MKTAHFSARSGASPARVLRLLLVITSASLVGASCSENDLIGQKAYEIDARFNMPQHVQLRAGTSPAAQINTRTGNLFMRIPLMNYPTPVHHMPADLAYNSRAKSDGSEGGWRWFFDHHLDDTHYTDATGARSLVESHVPGQPIRGTGMIYQGKSGSTTILRSQSGWFYYFDGIDGKLEAVRPMDVDYPHLRISYATVDGVRRPTKVRVRVSQTITTDVYAFEYDSLGKIVEVTDDAGRLALLEWDGDDLLRVYGPLESEGGSPSGGPLYDFSYSGSQMSSFANKEGETLAFSYESGQVQEVVQVRDVFGDETINPTHSFVYDPNLTRYTDPEGTLFEFEFSIQGKLTRLTNTDTGTYEAWTWNSSRPSSYDDNGVTTQYTWTSDRLSQEMLASGNTRVYEYDPLCLDPAAFPLDGPVRNVVDRAAVARLTDDVGLISEMECDARGRPVLFRNGEGEETAVAYIWNGLSIGSVTSEDGTGPTLSNYSDTGFASWIASPGSWVPAQVRTINSFGRLEVGTRAMQLDLGDVSHRDFDLAGRVTEIHMRDGSSFTVQYGSDGRMTYIDRPGGGDSRLVYNELGWQTELEEFVDGTWVTLLSYEHDLLGRITRTVRANGSSTEATYDSDGNPLHIENFWGTTQESWALFSYAGGRLTSKLDSETLVGWPEFYSYDQIGSLDSTVHPDSSVTRLTRDPRGRVTSEEFIASGGPTLFTRGYAYDLAGRKVWTCDGECDTGTILVERVINDGQVTQILYANGVERNLTYDQGEFTGATSTNAAGAIENTSVSYHRGILTDPLSWVQFQTTTYGAVEETSFERYEFTHNKLDCTDLGDGFTPCYEFDSQHNITAETTAGPDPATFTYNSTENRLLSVTYAGGSVANHAYDDSGYRVSHGGIPITWTATGKPASIGSGETLVWSATGQLLQRTEGGVTTEYTHGGAIRSVNGSLRLEDPDFVREIAAGTTHFRHLDNRGNVKFVTDDAGEVVAHLRYGAFGLEEIVGVDQTTHFVGQEEFSNGLMLLGSRLYDGYTFLSQDPFLQIYCQYCYTFADPVNWADRTGTFPTAGEILAYVGTVAGAVGGMALAAESAGLIAASGGLALAAAPLMVIGGAMLVVGTTIVFVSTHWDGKYEGPGNGSGGDSPKERGRQCLGHVPQRVDWGDMGWLDGMWDSVGFGGTMIGWVDPGQALAIGEESCA